jgi:outer membrane protein assembly factor BamD (BamD/ComL family)
MEIRSALRSGAAERALLLLDRYDQHRTNPALDAEAALLRIETLSRLGQRERAAELAERFVREHPHDALADRARRFSSKGASAAPR